MAKRRLLQRRSRRQGFEKAQRVLLHPGMLKPSIKDQERRKWDTAKALKGIGAPSVLIRLCLLFFTRVAVGDRCFDQVEYMAGKHACTRAAWDSGKTAFPYEI